MKRLSSIGIVALLLLPCCAYADGFDNTDDDFGAAFVAGLVIAAVIGLIPAVIAHQKGRSFIGWWVFGFAFFLIALIASLCIRSRKRCPACHEWMRQEASVCPHCRTDLVLRRA